MGAASTPRARPLDDRLDVLDRFRVATDHEAAARGLSDRELFAAYHALTEEPGDLICDAIIAEIERRELDL